MSQVKGGGLKKQHVGLKNMLRYSRAKGTKAKRNMSSQK